MDTATRDALAEERARIAATPLADLNPGRSERFQNDVIWPVFDRLRAEDPVHLTEQSEFGRYWSITRWDDIMAVDTNHEVFSSAEGITLPNLEMMEQQTRMMAEKLGEDMATRQRRQGAGFITMDEPEHGVQRKAVSPTLAPGNIAKMAPIVRERAGQILDGLPIGKEFDWVDLVSKELTAMTLATLFDFPFEERRLLPYWSDVITNPPGHGPVKSLEQKVADMYACFARFRALWEERQAGPPGIDLISMLAHNPETANMEPTVFQGNVILLIVGGNDTTRNTISGSVYALNKFPDQYDKLRANPALIPSMVSETIRWQTPLAHMSRVATRDVEFQGKQMKAGDRVVMWYLSGNRDESRVERPNDYIIDRARAREHLSFGFGIHRCVGNRVAEMQLTIIWEEILRRFPEIKLVGEPVRSFSNFIHGFESMPVVIPRKN